MITGASPRPPISVAVVADVRLYREGLSASLASRNGLVVVGSAASLETAITIAATTRPDVVVLDMATRESLEIARGIMTARPATRVIAFAVEEDDHVILSCAEAGVAAWVACEGSVDDLVVAIHRAVRNELVCSPSLTATLFRRVASLAHGAPTPTPKAQLTGRERQVVALIDRGLSNKEIAQRLHLEIATVKNHVHNILEKLRVSRRGEVAARLRSSAPGRSPRVLASSQV
jgi:two-component system, NarL family, nitrate/nitrite response regulator NarL